MCCEPVQDQINIQGQAPVCTGAAEEPNSVPSLYSNLGTNKNMPQKITIYNNEFR